MAESALERLQRIADNIEQKHADTVAKRERINSENIIIAVVMFFAYLFIWFGIIYACT